MPSVPERAREYTVPPFMPLACECNAPEQNPRPGPQAAPPGREAAPADAPRSPRAPALRHGPEMRP